MSERETTDMFMNTLQGNYIERLVARPSISFAEIVIAGERIESLLKMGRIQDNSAPKKPFAGNSQRRREGETSVVYAGRGRGRGRPNYYQDQVAAVTIPTPAPQPQQQPQYHPQQQPRLIDMNLYTLRTLAPPIDPNNLPRGYDVNARCAFHSNAPSHTTDNCKALQLKRINAVDSGETLNLVFDVTKVKTSLSVVKDRLLKGQIFLGCGEECRNCQAAENGCDSLRRGIQQLIDEDHSLFPVLASQSCLIENVGNDY
ncbi:hypothetical protein KIW84_062756 [Lathyrus oleraceus]|uniref:Uncharacterized protein n=1 Tax=Pisum sativum TaxID=3888 RepID=A0A9D4W7V7_PEA|nr:hypothetical protein KIW84_062756 [Pisum sativum]